MTATLIRGASLVTGGQPPRRASVLIAGGRIRSVGGRLEGAARRVGAVRVDLDGGWIAPGLVDLHTHGAVGVDFVTAGREELDRAGGHFAAHGVTGLLLSLYPEPPADMVRTLERLSSLVLAGAGRGIPFGFHLEGPYLSPAKPGALPGRHFRTYDRAETDALLRAGRGLVRTMTLAPELPGGHALVKHLVRKGVVPSFAHSAAGYDETRKAIAAGVRHATHLFNAMNGIHHRAPGPVTALLEDPRVIVELIADGHHVQVPLLRMVHELKDRRSVTLVSDSVAPCGLPPGRYSFAGAPVDLRDGRVTLPDGTLAGSALTLDRAVALHVKELGFPVEEAILLASANPARLVGEKRRGEIRPGFRADLVHLDERLRPRRTWVAGELAWPERPEG